MNIARDELARRISARDQHGRQARVEHALALSAATQEEREAAAMRHTFHVRQERLWSAYAREQNRALLAMETGR